MRVTETPSPAHSKRSLSFEASTARQRASAGTVTPEKEGLSGRELVIELERIRNRNRELQLLIESERIKRFRAQARKGLEIKVEE